MPDRASPMNAAGRLVLHPSLGAYTNKWLRNIGLSTGAIVAIGLLYAVYRSIAVSGSDVTVPAAVAGLALLALLFFGRAEICLDGDVLSYRRFVIRRRFPIQLVGGIALRRVSLAWNFYAREPTKAAVVYGKNRRALFSLSAALWSDRDLGMLQKAIGGDSSTEPMTAVDLQSEFPGALPGWGVFMEAHPAWTMAIVIPLAFAVIVGGVAAWDAIK